MRLVAAFALLMLLAAPAFAVEVTLTASRPCSGSLLAEPVCESARCSASRTDTRFTAPASIALPSEGVARWRLSVRADDCWSASMETEPHGTVSMALLPAGAIAGSVQLPRGTSAAGMTMRVRSVPGTTQQIDGHAQCELARGRWRCVVPASELDARIEVGGFAPHYLWNVRVPPGEETQAGSISLAAGASVAGWVHVDDSSAGGAIVTLTPRTFDAGGRGALRKLTAKANARGFFQFIAVSEGPYAAVAAKEGWSPSLRGDVDVEKEVEHALRDPLALQPLASLEVAVKPALSPDGEPWSLQLARPVPMQDGFAVMLDERVGADGAWRHAALEAGRYRISVADARGSVYASREVDVVAGMPPLELQIDRVAVRGTVRVGDDPLPSRLTLVDDEANLVFETDADGRFAFTLPHEGTWELELMPKERRLVLARRKVEIRRREGESVAELEIELPAGRIAGIVTYDDGTPAEADLRIWRGGKLESYTITDEKGAFELVGIAMGRVDLEALSADHASSVTLPLDVVASGAPLRLVLERLRSVEGRVMTRSGRPVPGAMIRYLAGGVRPAIRHVVSDPRGRFQLSMRRDNSAMPLVVIAAGLPLKIASVAPPPDGPLEIVVDGVPALLKVAGGTATPWPAIGRDGGPLLGFRMLLYTEDPTRDPRGRVPGGFAFELEPGTYTVCPELRADVRCETVTLPPRGEATVDARAWRTR